MSEKIHIGELIRNKLDESERSAAWLARKTYCDRSNLCKLLKKNSIDTKLLFDISNILNYDFFSHYSNAFHKSKRNEE